MQKKIEEYGVRKVTYDLVKVTKSDVQLLGLKCTKRNNINVNDTTKWDKSHTVRVV